MSSNSAATSIGQPSDRKPIPLTKDRSNEDPAIRNGIRPGNARQDSSEQLGPVSREAQGGHRVLKRSNSIRSKSAKHSQNSHFNQQYQEQRGNGPEPGIYYPENHGPEYQGGPDMDNDPLASVTKHVKNFFRGTEPSVKQRGSPYQYSRDDDQKYIRDLEYEMETLRVQLQNQKYAIEKMQSDLQVERFENAKIKNSADKIVAVMENKDLFIGPQEADSTVITKFKGLVGKIKTWSLHFAGDPTKGLRMQPDTVEQFRKIAPEIVTVDNLIALLSNRKRRRLFIQGWIGHVLVENVFQTFEDNGRPRHNGLDCWMGQGVAESVSIIEKTLDFAGTRSQRAVIIEVLAPTDPNLDTKVISHREFHDWRAFSIGLLSRVESMSQLQDAAAFLKAEVHTITVSVMSILSPWVPEEKQEEVKVGLGSILETAIRLSQLLRRQRACWTICYPAGVSPFPQRNSTIVETHDHTSAPVFMDPSTMIDMDDDEDDEDEHGLAIVQKPTMAKPIELLIFPAVFKRGNADGEQYEHESCFAKAVVKCK